MQFTTGDQFVSCGEDGYVTIWDLRKPIFVDKIHCGTNLYNLKYNRAKGLILAHDHEINGFLFRINNGAYECQHLEFLSYLGGSKFSPDGETLLVATYFGVVYFDVESGLN